MTKDEFLKLKMGDRVRGKVVVQIDKKLNIEKEQFDNWQIMLDHGTTLRISECA